VTPDRMGEAGDEAALRAAPVPAGWDEAVRLEEDPATIPDPAEVDVPDDLRAEIEAHMAKYPDRHSASLPALGAAQRRHGWCSPEAIRQVAAVMQVTPAYLSSVATFYDMLRTEPIGSRYVYVCTSVACHLRNAKSVYDAIWEEARDQGLDEVEVREFECLGACDMAPMASADGRYVGPLSEEDAPEIVSAVRERREVLPGRALEDTGYKLPWEDGVPAVEPPAELAHPEVAPAGGTVKEQEEVPTGREPETPPAIEQPLAPGTVSGAEEEEEEQREFSLGPWDPDRQPEEEEEQE
jgi:NADH-quinone oxidoreductase subunit E